jgi:hypothetical protein
LNIVVITWLPASLGGTHHARDLPVKLTHFRQGARVLVANLRLMDNFSKDRRAPTLSKQFAPGGSIARARKRLEQHKSLTCDAQTAQ